MKLTLLQDLVCPCGGDLELTRVLESESNSSQNPTDIMSGWLRCGKCRENFPIIEGVPRDTLDPLRSTLKREYPEFFSNAVEHSETEPFAGYESKLRTMRSFGYESATLLRFPTGRGSQLSLVLRLLSAGEPTRKGLIGCGLR